MRVTSNMQNQNMVNTMMKNQSKLANLQVQLASGSKLNYVSDNPSVIPSIMDATKMLNKIDIYENNIAFLNGESEVTEGTLSQVTDMIQRLSSLTVEAANGTNGADQLKLINNEVKQIKEQLVALGNTCYDNQYIFAGNKTSTIPFTINDDGSITYNGTPSTEDYKRNYTIADGVDVNINLAGDKVLGYSNLVNEGPPPVYEGEGILQIVNELSNLLNADVPDYDAIRAQLDPINAAQNNILAARTEMGGVQSRLTMTKEQHENSKLTYSSLKSELKDIDISQVVTDLSTQQVSLQASLYAGSQIMSISLLDYL
ncbi:MAG: flagellar hook-associated protein FlgL [Candidatus Gastranaerophilales bacterium]|nr:flagellar hook-associated protein FlgL [Candidatus Gastranaerophilales bacterium]